MKYYIFPDRVPLIWHLKTHQQLLKCICKYYSTISSSPQPVMEDKAPSVLPILSSIHAHLPMLLSVMCHHWCFPFHLGFPSIQATFPYKCVPEEIHNCCVARPGHLSLLHGIKKTPPIAFITDSRPECICKSLLHLFAKLEMPSSGILLHQNISVCHISC